MMKLCSAVLLTGAAAWDLPGDCRNQTVDYLGGVLPTMSYHIHYTTDKTKDLTEFKTFYEDFIAKFSDKFGSDKTCPFGPNYGAYSSDTFPSQTICSLEGALEFEILGNRADVGGNPWGSLHQRAFFVPIEFIDETWEWSKENRGSLDVVKHPNSGCMHDDHGIRKVWEGTAHTISTLDFPCNVPATGCQDNDYSGPPSCGCSGTLQDDAPEHSCKNCVVMGTLPPDMLFA